MVLYCFEFIDTVVRSSTIPEELGRISFLLSDKTGTLTMNEMRFKKIHLGTVAFSSDAFEVSFHLYFKQRLTLIPCSYRN